MAPPFGSSSPTRCRSSVDFPQPEPPRITKMSPRRISKVTSFMRTRSPQPIVRPSARITVSGSAATASEAIGVEDQREREVDHDEVEEDRDDRGGRRSADARRAAGGREAALAADHRDGDREDEALQDSGRDGPDRQRLPRLDEVAVRGDLEAEDADEESAEHGD